MSHLALNLFGTPRLERDGVPVHISRRKAMALLAYMAATGQVHSRDSLAALLWPENDPFGARGGLRRTLSEIKGVLGEGWLTADRENAQLTPNKSTENLLSLDVAIFQEKLTRCEAHHHQPTIICDECLLTLEDAVKLYQGDFMAGFCLKNCPDYDEWQFFQREQLRTQLANALQWLSSYYQDAREYETAIRYTRRWLALDPLHEEAHRHLMDLYDRSGQRSAALRQYQICRETLAEELGVEPAEETKKQYQQVQTHTLRASKDLRLNHNLPVQTTPFIGRERELAEIRAKIKDGDCRLLTLLGPGGSGKTRLAIEVAGGLLDDFQHGVFFVNLAPLQSADLIPTTVAGALRFQFSGELSPEEQLLEYLGNKKMLLILDNFEQILAGVNLVIKIMNEAPGVTLLVTSRTRLMTSAENVYDVKGMVYPEGPISIKHASDQYSAIRLFESYACRVQANFRLSDDDLADVIRICSLLEGMPLGIVLAASWVTMLSPKEIAMEIARDLAFLEKELQDLPERQRSMRSVFNHSWRLLSEREQKILAALSVFRGGFTREAAQAVTEASLDTLSGLIDKSMLHRDTQGRFEIHELLRQYAAEKLADDPEGEITVRDQHGNYFWQALANWENGLEGSRPGITLQEMTSEIDNIRAAWRWGIERTSIKKSMWALNSLGSFYNLQNLFSEGVKAFQFAAAKLTPTNEKTHSVDKSRELSTESLKLWIMALLWGGFLNHRLGNSDLARSLLQKSLTLIENYELPDWDKDVLKAGTLNALGLALYAESRDESIQLQLESVRLFKSLGLDFHVVYVLENLGHIAKKRKDRIAFFEESLEMSRKLGNLTYIATALTCLASENIEMLNLQQAEKMAIEAKRIYEQMPYRLGEIYSTRILGPVYLLQGNFQKAQDIQQGILKVYHDLDNTPFWAHANSLAGFPDLHMGNYEAACTRAKKSIEISNGKPAVWFIASTALANAILGQVSLVKRSYQEAQQLFRKATLLFEKLFNENLPVWQVNISQELANLGLAKRGLGKITSAKNDIMNALGAAVKLQSGTSLIHIFPGMALLLAEQGEVERAVELNALATTLGIVANSKWFADIAGDEIAAMAEKLPLEVVEAAKARGRELDLWETAEKLLVELEELGWEKGKSCVD